VELLAELPSIHSTFDSSGLTAGVAAGPAPIAPTTGSANGGSQEGARTAGECQVFS
jgi:hypothetical protein